MRRLTEKEYFDINSYSKILSELKAKEELERDYELVKPDYYGTYCGEKIYDVQRHQEYLNDPIYLRASPQWLKKDRNDK